LTPVAVTLFTLTVISRSVQMLSLAGYEADAKRAPAGVVVGVVSSFDIHVVLSVGALPTRTRTPPP
jgi:hypothetical protein